MNTHQVKHLENFTKFVVNKAEDEFITYALIKGGLSWWHLKNFYEKKKQRDNFLSKFLTSKSSQQKELQS